MKVTVDKEYLVTNVEFEKTEPLHSCKGPRHYRDGSGTDLPISQFSIAKSGPYKGGLGALCNDCLQRNREAYARKKATGVIEDDTTIEKLILNGHMPADKVEIRKLPKWRVTVIKEISIEVSAADYLDAGVQAGDGEVVRIERL